MWVSCYDCRHMCRHMSYGGSCLWTLVCWLKSGQQCTYSCPCSQGWRVDTDILDSSNTHNFAESPKMLWATKRNPNESSFPNTLYACNGMTGLMSSQSAWKTQLEWCSMVGLLKGMNTVTFWTFFPPFSFSSLDSVNKVRDKKILVCCKLWSRNWGGWCQWLLAVCCKCHFWGGVMPVVQARC